MLTSKVRFAIAALALAGVAPAANAAIINYFPTFSGQARVVVGSEYSEGAPVVRQDTDQTDSYVPIVDPLLASKTSPAGTAPASGAVTVTPTYTVTQGANQLDVLLHSSFDNSADAACAPEPVCSAVFTSGLAQFDINFELTSSYYYSFTLDAPFTAMPTGTGTYSGEMNLTATLSSGLTTVAGVSRHFEFTESSSSFSGDPNGTTAGVLLGPGTYRILGQVAAGGTAGVFPLTSGTLDLDIPGAFDWLTAGSLGFSLSTTPPPAVPLPAAAWLLLSGLGGMAAFARRRNRPAR